MYCICCLYRGMYGRRTRSDSILSLLTARLWGNRDCISLPHIVVLMFFLLLFLIMIIYRAWEIALYWTQALKTLQKWHCAQPTLQQAAQGFYRIGLPRGTKGDKKTQRRGGGFYSRVFKPPHALNLQTCTGWGVFLPFSMTLALAPLWHRAAGPLFSPCPLQVLVPL